MAGHLIAERGSRKATRAEVEAVPVPDRTHSWHPIPYGQTIELTHEVVAQKLGLKVKREAYQLNKSGNQMFGLLTLETESDEQELSIGLRNSYNKSLSNGLAVGSKVMVCDNLCFSGNAFKVLRRNTTNGWPDFQALVKAHVGVARGLYDELLVDVEKMKGLSCGRDQGHAMLGIMQGQGLLSPTQATVAHGDWTKPRHEEFSERNLWSLYNCVTEGLKKGPPALTMDRHADAHDCFLGFAEGLS